MGETEMTSALLARRLSAIASHSKRLECPSPIHLGAFFYGYLLIVPGLAWLNDTLDRLFNGPEQARAWTRSYLALGDELGMARILEAAIGLLNDPSGPLVTVAHGKPDWFVDVVLEALDARRPATVLGECTIEWMYNFGLGAQDATEDHFPEVARERAEQLARFETWLQDYYDSPGVPWQRILRGFEGPAEAAIYRFGELWNEHLSG
ncbi:hypothetical protein WME95_36820 [Sorangium sp. So ce327]|jgi:hypothetical protein|uniref:hypothetical protein n=1 Tax=Sorangium sp. So ce327 TaxID=3133301 RepID=UPI003F5F3827